MEPNIFYQFSCCCIFYCSGGPIGSGSQRLFWGVGNHAAISVAGLGNGKEDWDSLEMIDGVKENVRIAAAGMHHTHYLQLYTQRF